MILHVAPSHDKDENHLDETDTHHGYWSGCSGAFMTAPGVFGSSTISGSGGRAEPSMLSDLVFAKRAVMSSREGTFLYPLILFSPLPPVSWFSCSSFSSVRGSVSRDASSGIEGVDDLGVWAELAVSAGDTERVDGPLTTTESLVAVVDRDVCEPVRKSEAARRGRAGEDEELFGLVRLIRAASWFSDGGRRLAGVRSGLGACSDWPDGGLDIVVVISSARRFGSHVMSCTRYQGSHGLVPLQPTIIHGSPHTQ